MFKFRTVSGRLLMLSSLPTLGALFIVVLVLIYSEGWSLKESRLVSESKLLNEAFHRKRIGFNRLNEGLANDYGFYLGQRSHNYENYSKSRIDFNLQLLQFNKDKTRQNHDLISQESKTYQRNVDDYLLLLLNIGKLDRGLSGKMNSLFEEFEKLKDSQLEQFPYDSFKNHMKGLVSGNKKELSSLLGLLQNYKAKNPILKTLLIDAKDLTNDVTILLDRALTFKKKIVQSEISLQLAIEELVHFAEGNYAKNLFFIKILISGSLIFSVLASIIFGQFVARAILHPIEILVDHLEAPERVGLSHYDFSNYKEIEFLASSIQKYETKISEQKRKIEVESRFLTLGQIASGLSHELRNPLAIIRGRAQLLERHRLISHEKIAHDSIHSIYDQVDRINKTLLGIRNIILGHKINQYEDFNFNNVLTHIRLLLNKKIKDEGIELNINVDANHIDFYGHEILMSEAIYSLINFSRNKVKNLERKKIDVKVRTNDKKIFIVISDSAINTLQKDVDESRQSGGMSIDACRKVVREHGGMLWSGNGRMGRFVLQLPRTVKCTELTEAQLLESLS